MLVVCSGTTGELSPFVREQMDSIELLGVEMLLFQIKKAGLMGYLLHWWPLMRYIRLNKPDLIHAHYGLSGLLANLQRRIPVVTTYHGSDINILWVSFFSWLSVKLSKQNIYVSQQLWNKKKSKRFSIIPCGVDINIFQLFDKTEARKKMGLSPNKRYILFSSRFDNMVKNYPLAKVAIEKLNKEDVELIELKGYSREEVSYLMNAVDMALLTSFNEGSPQFVKEALSCNLPIVATNVGDVKNMITGIEGCFITSFSPEDIAENIKKSLEYEGRNKGREYITTNGFDLQTVARKILDVYKTVVRQH